MSAMVQAIYEDGLLRLLTPLPLPEHTVVRVQIESLPPDAERAEWLAQGERKLREVWDNDADDAYNALLTE
jgi:predicted DNA-binding antitoxin AbrB/MazE fold protein